MKTNLFTYFTAESASCPAKIWSRHLRCQVPTDAQPCQCTVRPLQTAGHNATIIRTYRNAKMSYHRELFG